MSCIPHCRLTQNRLGTMGFTARLHLFVFTNSRKNRIKILFWDNTGWWLCAKRLEAGTLAWPASPTPSIELSSEELTLLLSGIDLSKTHRRPWLQRSPQNGSVQRDEKHSKPR